MAKVGIIPLKVLRQIVQLDKDKDGEMLVAIHFPSEKYIIDEEKIKNLKEPGESFAIIESKGF